MLHKIKTIAKLCENLNENQNNDNDETCKNNKIYAN